MVHVKEYYVATSLEDAHQRLKENPKNALLGGGTWMKYNNRTLNQLIDLSKLGLSAIEEDEKQITIGALTTLRDMEVHQSIKVLGDGFLSQALGSIMGVNFRHIATIGGSIFSKFSFSDILTPLLTLNASVKLYPDEIKPLEAFLEDKGDRTKILTHLIIEKQEGHGYFKKVAQVINDFCVVNVAIFKEKETKIAVGGRPQRAKLTTEAMRMLKDSKTFDEVLFTTVAQQGVQELRFGEDDRGSESYRKLLAETYIARGLKEVYSK